ncbi:MAG: hypothetical protein L6R39_000660 [Caloplaca ligustica]|nr:MAG: hypothetical protein L6R39_000660 [Caloplaca ligustica]
MLGLGRRDTTKWLNGWRLMEESAGSEAQAMANNVFGDPSLPYPEMGLISLLIKFSVTIPNSRPLFMRVCMAVDRDQWIEADGRICKGCHRLRLHNGDSGLGCDSVQGEEEEEELVFDNGISDTDADEGEEEDQFEPYPADDGFVTMEDRYD